MADPAKVDMRKIAKIHFIIHARVFLEGFVGYFDYDPEPGDIEEMVYADIQRQLVEHDPSLNAERLQTLVPEQYKAYSPEDLKTYEDAILARHSARRETLTSILAKFLAAFNDVPRAIDKQHHTELLYNFSPKGDKFVSQMLDQFDTAIMPYKSMLDNRDEKLWAVLNTRLQTTDAAKVAKKEEDEENINLLKQLDLYNSWQDCDDANRRTIWAYIDKLVGFGNTYSMYGMIPDDMMKDMVQCAQSTVQGKTAYSKDDLKSSLLANVGQMMQKMDKMKMAQIGIQMMQKNPQMLQNAMMKMASSFDGSTPNFNVADIMKDILPPGMDVDPAQLQQIVGQFMGNINPAASPQITPEISAMAAQMMQQHSQIGNGGGGGGAKE